MHECLHFPPPLQIPTPSRPDRYPPQPEHFNIVEERWEKVNEEYTGRHYIYTRAGIQYSRYDDEQTRVVGGHGTAVLWSRAE